MALPKITAETADVVTQTAQKNPQHYIDHLKDLVKSNPLLYQYIDYTISLVNKKYSKEMAVEVASIVAMVLGLLESQAEADKLSAQFGLGENT